MKRVIFVGGTEFSGSTFFHMILANDPRGFAIGEAHNFLRPSQPHHFDMRCSCGETPCAVWQEVKSAGEEHLYQTIFDRFPDIEFIVDSSKNPFWIRSQTANLSRQGINTQNILMWKTPYEFAHSYHKRGNAAAWERSWVSYHRVYRTFFAEWRAIRYWDFVQKRSALESVCSYLNIPYFQNKEQYWEKIHHVVGGNPSARVHLYADNSSDYQDNVRRSTSKIEVSEKGLHQSIYYESNLDPEVKNSVEDRLNNNPHVIPILNMLEARDIMKPNDPLAEAENLEISEPMILLRKVKYSLARKFSGRRYKND